MYGLHSLLQNESVFHCLIADLNKIFTGEILWKRDCLELR